MYIASYRNCDCISFLLLLGIKLLPPAKRIALKSPLSTLREFLYSAQRLVYHNAHIRFRTTGIREKRKNAYVALNIKAAGLILHLRIIK